MTMKDYRHRRVPITCGHEGCEEVHLMHHAFAADIIARGWLCPEHEPRQLDPEITHTPRCRGGGSSSRLADGSVLHRCFGCGATRVRRPRDPQEPRDDRPGGTR